MKQHSHILKNVRMLSCQKFKILQYLKFFFVLFNEAVFKFQTSPC